MMKISLSAKFLLCITTAFQLLGVGLGAHEPDLLKSSDISKIMKQLLDHHVDKKEISTTTLQQAVLLYIDQFDPHHIYLLESEVAPYTNIPKDQLQALLDQYKHDNYAIFRKLNGVIQLSIERSRKLRSSIEKERDALLKKILRGEIGPEQNIPSAQFAKTVDELKERLTRHFAAFLEVQRRRFGEAGIAQKKDQLNRVYENELREFENGYTFQDAKGDLLPAAEQENLFIIHVLKALSASLDSHTSFYRANEAYDMRVRLEKQFQGIGIILKETPEGPVVIHLLEGGPAEKSGLLKVSDLLVEVDGKKVGDYSFDQVMDFLHDPKNSMITLVVMRPITGQPSEAVTVKLKREAIILDNDRVDTSYEAFGNGIIGKIKLHSFYQNDNGVTSEKDVKDAISKLDAKGNLRGLILDLRDNSGGFLSQAVKVAGLFISNGIIVISKYSNGDEKFYRDVDSSSAFKGPLIILTSKITASAAEIVAQALQDYGVALVVGDEHTYGKGTIQTQTVTDNQSSSYFKVTVGEYFTVSGKTPQKEGVKADIVAPSHWSNEQIGEEFLDSVNGTTIPPHFDDSLADVNPESKTWYLKYYMPSMQHKTTKWRNLLPALRKNSGYRIANNKNYQFYLKKEKNEDDDDDTIASEEEWISLDKKHKNAGEDDLQLQEAVNILKDMILLEGAPIPPESKAQPVPVGKAEKAHQ